MARGAQHTDVKTIGVDVPAGLTFREIAVFRLGVLKTLLAAADEFGHELPGIYRQAYEGEIAYREQVLEDTA